MSEIRKSHEDKTNAELRVQFRQEKELLNIAARELLFSVLDLDITDEEVVFDKVFKCLDAKEALYPLNARLKTEEIRPNYPI